MLKNAALRQLALLGGSAALICAAWSQAQATNPGSADGSQFYETRVKPIFAQNCYPCHTNGQAGGLRVDSREALLKGGDSGPAINPGNPDKSLLIEAVKQTGELKMPKGGHLKQEQIDTLVSWVAMGAPWSAPPSAPAALSSSATPPAAAAGNEFFENKVRPLLATRCSPCHTQMQSGGLALTSRQALLKGGERGPAIVPGDPDKSLLIEAVQQTGELKMPKGGHLKQEEIDALVQWVKMGAPWPDSGALQPTATASGGVRISDEQRQFWSFRPLQRPEIPNVKDEKWARSNIDRFVLAKLESKGMKPVPLAGKRDLIRRATYDLTGLPPTPEEIEAFEKDKSSGAFAKVIDRLLDSPRYGERWGRHWLDVARYAEDDVRGLDPKGRGYMPFEGAYVYRDWVIDAFNKDMPFNQFVRAQLAGDLFDAKDRDKMLPGTAFLGQAPWVWDQAEPVQGRADERNERIDAISRGLLGLTVACARCHNHKYDPITQKDYYALAGVFASTTYKEYPRVSAAQAAVWQEKEQRILDLEEEQRNFEKTESDQLAQILAHQTAKYMAAAWQVTGKPKQTVAEAAEKERVDQEMLNRWVKFLTRPQSFYPYLNDWKAMTKAGGTEDQAKFLAGSFQKRVLRIMAEAQEIKEENDVIKAKAGVKKRSMRDAKPNEFETQDQFCPGCDLELKALPTDEAKLWLDLFVRSLDSPEDERAEPGLFVFRGYALEHQLSPEWKDHMEDLHAQIEALKKELPPEYPFVHGVADRQKPVDIPVNLRGNPHNLGDPVPRRFIAVLSKSDPPPFEKGSGRLDLANDIVASPLFARLFVNRVWRWHFGTGLVETPDNFGKMGERPSDPELLEYLAFQFVQDGMSVKKLQREIMLTTVYQLSTEDDPKNDEKDASNRLYWRFNRQRLDAEEIRDSILFVAGDLDLKKVGGPSSDFTPDNTRRTVYSKISRYRLNNYLQVFDFPNPSVTDEERFTTNVPLQRLYFMNNAFVYAQAAKLAGRVYSKGSDEARIGEAYRLVFGRAPSSSELQLGLQFLQANPDKPVESVNGEPSTAWKEYARVLMSSNEFEFVN